LFESRKQLRAGTTFSHEKAAKNWLLFNNNIRSNRVILQLKSSNALEKYAFNYRVRRIDFRWRCATNMVDASSCLLLACCFEQIAREQSACKQVAFGTESRKKIA
jgi:hypothetical protein